MALQLLLSKQMRIFKVRNLWCKRQRQKRWGSRAGEIKFGKQSRSLAAELLKFIFPLGIAALLASCAAPIKAPLDQHMSWQTRREKLLTVKAWKIRGALALRTSKQSFSASMNWQQTSINHFQINLFGPLGIGAVKITSMPGKVILQTADNKQYVGQSAQTLLQQQLGWKLPVSRLYYWIRGLQAPNSHAKVKFDRYHHILSLKSKNWQVSYLNYTAVNGFDLPQKIRLITPFSRAVIVISHWQI